VAAFADVLPGTAKGTLSGGATASAALPPAFQPHLWLPPTGISWPVIIPIPPSNSPTGLQLPSPRPTLPLQSSMVRDVQERTSGGRPL